MTTTRLSWPASVIPQVMLSQKVYWQDIAFAIAGATLPIFMGLAPAFSFRNSPVMVDGHRMVDLLIPGGMATSIVWILYNAINSAARRRQTRTYKRLRATPIPDSAIVAGEAVSAALPAFVQSAIVLAVGVGYLGSPLPSHLLLVALGIAVGAASIAVFAFGISGLLPSGEVSTWLMTPFIGAAWFLSGAMGVPSADPSTVDRVAQFLPSTATVQIVRTAYFAQDYVTLGLASRPEISFGETVSACSQPLGVLIGWAGIGAWLFSRFFAWDPRKSAGRSGSATVKEVRS